MEDLSQLDELDLSSVLSIEPEETIQAENDPYITVREGDVERRITIDPTNIPLAVNSPFRTTSLFEFIMARHPPTWSSFFQGAMKEIKHACYMVDKDSRETGKSWLPNIPDTLAAFWLCPMPMVKVIILGQDPYHNFAKTGKPNAIGVCFGSHREHEIPGSLQSVYAELERTVEGWKNPGHPDITKWGIQGVLLVNSALTCRAKVSGSHNGYWKPFAEKLMAFINTRMKDVVFLLWGRKAQGVASDIYTSKHTKLEAYHPSGRAANSGYSFSGCDHFNLANEKLVEKGIEPIDWRL